MNVTDEQLRSALHARAQRVAAPLDLFDQVEARARSIRRHRVAGAVAGAVAAVIAIAVIVPTVVLGGGSSQTPVIGPSPTTAPTGGSTPTPTTSSSPSPSPSTSATSPAAAAYALDPADPWAYRGDQQMRANDLAAFQSAWSARHPGSAMVPLFGEIYEPSAQPEFVFVAQTSEGPRWGFASMRPSGIDFLIDQPLASGTTVLAAAVPGDEVARLLVVGAPDVQAIQYAGDGTTFRDMLGVLAPGVRVGPLEGNTAVDQIRVIGADGQPIFTGAAPEPAPAG
jgi:hypothetical protein